MIGPIEGCERGSRTSAPAGGCSWRRRPVRESFRRRRGAFRFGASDSDIRHAFAPHVNTAVDCGRYVNPQGPRKQIEGATICRSTVAQSGKNTISTGAVVQSSFRARPIAPHERCSEAGTPANAWTGTPAASRLEDPEARRGDRVPKEGAGKAGSEQLEGLTEFPQERRAATSATALPASMANRPWIRTSGSPIRGCACCRPRRPGELGAPRGSWSARPSSG